MTITNDKLAELKRLARQEAAYYKDQWDLGPTLKADGWQHGLAAYLDACAPQTILSLLALAERALEPQGRALCHVRYRCTQRWDGNGNHEPQIYEGYEVCEAHQRGDDGSDAIPVFSPTANPLTFLVHEGWKLVPIVPTEKMICYGIEAYKGKCEESYAAMVAVAPPPPYASQLALPAGRDEELLALHRKLAAETLRADQGWSRYEAANAARNRAEAELAERAGALPAGPVPELAIGVTVDHHHGATIAIHQPHGDGTTTVLYSETHYFGDSVASFKLASPSPAVAQPVADERAWKPSATQVMEWARLRGFGYKLSAEQICGLADDIIAHVRAALGQPAEEGDKA